MSLSTRIAPHLAYLRRFSRAVTGSQTSGDAYVAATLGGRFDWDRNGRELAAHLRRCAQK